MILSMKSHNNTRGSSNSEIKSRKLVKMNLAASLPDEDQMFFLNPTPDKDKNLDLELVITFKHNSPKNVSNFIALILYRSSQ
jgi:hypothetical protein